MSYSVVSLLAALILIIENQDLFLNRQGTFALPAWRAYRRLLICILIYYLTDIAWGWIEGAKLSGLLFADTTVYFISMSAGILFWTQYAAIYLDENDGFSRFLKKTGLVYAAVTAALTVLNIFTPILFTVDEGCVYVPLDARYVILTGQILMLLLTTARMIQMIILKHRTGEKSTKHRTLAFFGLIMVVFLSLQLFYPYLPLYAMAYMLGTCAIRAFVIADEKEEYRDRVEEADRIRTLQHSITSLLDNIPGLNYSKDAETGVYLACNQSFAEYAHRENPGRVIGLTDAEIFDEATAKHFVECDRKALSMGEPYIFFEDVRDAAGNPRQFQTTKLKFTDAEGRLCLLGLSEDVTDIVSIRRENALAREAYEQARRTSTIYTHISQTLARGYRYLYYVNMETEDFIEYHIDRADGRMREKRRETRFFDRCAEDIGNMIYPEDREALRRFLSRENLQAALDSTLFRTITYRQMVGDKPAYYRMTVSRMEDDDRFIVIGINDIDEEMKRRQAAERLSEERNAYARINALTGDYLCIYIVNPETGNYRVYSRTEGFEEYTLPAEGKDFFSDFRVQGRRIVCPEDQGMFLTMFTQKGVREEVNRSGIFIMSYRMNNRGKPTYVQVRTAMTDEKEGRRLIVGINDIDAQVRQEEEYAKRLAQAQSLATIDALTGLRNKHAYLDAEEKLDARISNGEPVEFAVTILDLNNLKQVNDTKGHQEGDKYICEAARIICEVYSHSPVFRVGGDEFAVISQGQDYQNVEELTNRMAEHNDQAIRGGGIVIACGMAKSDGDASVSSVYKRADRKMYENKNRLKAAQEESGNG